MSAPRNLSTRTLDVLEVLCGYAATGATNADLAHAAHTTPAERGHRPLLPHSAIHAAHVPRGG